MTNKTGQINYFNSLLGKELNQTYRIDSQVALGGMGAVFRGVHLANGDSVAIKVISPHLTANSVFVKRFQREAKVGTILSHPNIVKVYEFGETSEGVLFMAMEFIEGKTLDEYLSRSAPLNVMRSLEILRPLCEALDAAHRRNILHRDLKPANVLISKDKSGRETIKLVDFGLVKLMQPDSEITAGNNLTAMGEACGTPYYMSPEQVIGQPLGPTADIYSLGIILYQMLTAKMPIESNNVRQILAIKINQDLQPPSEKFPFIPRILDPLMQRVLARDPRKRYQTGKELLDDFQRTAFDISLEYSSPTQPVLDQSLLSEVRKNYIAAEENFSPEVNLQAEVNQVKPLTPIVEKEITTPQKINQFAQTPPIIQTPPTQVSPITQVPPIAQVPIEIVTPPIVSLPSQNQLNNNHFQNNFNLNQEPIIRPIKPIRITDSSEKQVKLLIIIVGVLFGLLIITVALFIMQK
ncbi:MAG: serine/threonine protein kinase [Acidobacteria bacterium]|nr:serine/threonine protein kinase [Acidobacteriota bacterium]